ncbi:MAG: hypothetical protein WAT81_01935 [Candidatus Moraniibacteriota bacterium]
MELLSKKKSEGSSTQKYVDVEEIRDGVLILKTGALRAVLLVSSINFDLKSSEEQDAIIAQYQNFLNSLDFPVQITVQSRRFNIDPYIELLKEKEVQQANELLRFQMREYQGFIKNLTEISNIMSKFFYVVIPFSPVENAQGGFFQKMGDIFNQKKTAGLKNEVFDTYRTQLMQRVEHVVAGLSPMSVRATVLQTEELIELLYNSYNPSLFASTIVKNVESIELQ